MKQSCLTPTLPSERTTHFFQTRSERQQSSSDSNWRTPASARPAAAALIGRGAPSPSPPDWRTRGAAGAAAQAPAAAAFRPSQRWPACLRTRTGRGHKISSRHEDVAPERASCKPAKGKDCDLHVSLCMQFADAPFHTPRSDPSLQFLLFTPLTSQMQCPSSCTPQFLTYLLLLTYTYSVTPPQGVGKGHLCHPRCPQYITFLSLSFDSTISCMYLPHLLL